MTYLMITMFFSLMSQQNTLQVGRRLVVQRQIMRQARQRSKLKKTHTGKTKHTPESRNSQQNALNDAVVNRTFFPENSEIYDLLLFFANSRGPLEQFLREQLEKPWNQMVFFNPS